MAALSRRVRRSSGAHGTANSARTISNVTASWSLCGSAGNLGGHRVSIQDEVIAGNEAVRA